MHLLDSELGGSSQLSVLDVGCGAGRMLGPLSRYGEVAGIDTSEELVRHCRERGFERVSVGSACALPVPGGSVDLITLFDTIEHGADDGRVLEQCRDALTADGMLFLSAAYQFLYANNDRLDHHQRRYTARQLRHKLAAAGLDPIKVTYFNTLLFPLILPVVLLKKMVERRSVSNQTTNLSHEAPPLNRLLAATVSSERHLLSRISLPFGHSIIAMAKRT
ncbi:MAG: class I SAM-dependent methyltransferase [Solirubrobacteraceae bacterium]|nr:MAG: hypothetical protein DLM63_06345 [Solirubrobacterales bacterium]